jgi:phosphocarrier protein HPr
MGARTRVSTDLRPRRLTICNSRGLHARASAKFVRCAERFDAHVAVTRDGQTVGGTSIMGLMMLAAACGSTIDVAAEGPDAKAALDAIEALVAAKFDED